MNTACAFEFLNPGTPFDRTWHIQAMTHALSEVYAGHTRRLLITAPPRHLKTICCTAFSAWALGKDPRLRFVAASYAEALSREQMKDFRTIVRSPLHGRLFPDLRVLDFVTTQNGGRRGVPRGGAVTGFGADIIKREMVMFGHAKHDDQVDSITQFVAWASCNGGQRALKTVAERKAREARSGRR